MKEKEINLHFTNHGSTTGEEIIIRHGEAAAPVELTGYNFSGDINCVLAYMQAKKEASPLQRPVTETSVVEINSKEMSVTLRIDPHQPNAAVVSGKLELSNELEPFKINKPTTFTRESLVKLLRHNKALFPNKEQYESLLGAYMSFSAQAVIDMKASSDTRGNKAGSYSKAVNSYDLPTLFVLEAPIFKGLEASRFQVEVALEVTDGAVAFWFESPELSELEQNTAKALLDINAKYANALGIAVLVK